MKRTANLKETLVAGMVVVRRNGIVNIVANVNGADGTVTQVFVSNEGSHKYMRADRFNADLTHVKSDKYDIVEIYSLVSLGESTSADFAAESTTETRTLVWKEADDVITVDDGVSIAAEGVQITIPTELVAKIAQILEGLGK